MEGLDRATNTCKRQRAGFLASEVNLTLVWVIAALLGRRKNRALFCFPRKWYLCAVYNYRLLGSWEAVESALYVCSRSRR